MMTQTLLAIKNGKMAEFPASDKHTLKDRVLRGATWDDGRLVYGYILNRNSLYRHPYYGWAIDRN
jgi:hypothetical protein